MSLSDESFAQHSESYQGLPRVVFSVSRHAVLQRENTGSARTLQAPSILDHFAKRGDARRRWQCNEDPSRRQDAIGKLKGLEVRRNPKAHKTTRSVVSPVETEAQGYSGHRLRLSKQKVSTMRTCGFVQDGCEVDPHLVRL